MKRKPPQLVSVLMPAYNAEQFIDEAIQSILQQTYTNFELIIIDDYSSDNTYKIAKSYANKDKRITVYKNNNHSNIALTRNKLIEKARGAYIAWQDADDISYPYRLKHQLEQLDKHPQIGIIGGYLVFFEDNKELSIRKYATNDAKLRKRIFRYSPVAQPAAMIRKECFVKVGLYNNEYPPAEDIDMTFRIGTHYTFANLAEKIIKYRVNENSATYKNLYKIELSTFKIRLKNILNPRYHFTLIDLSYNVLQFLLMFMLPSRLKIMLFNKIRNSNIYE